MALAYLLARRGLEVTVLETHLDFGRVFRGEGLQRSGIDVFQQMGLGEEFDRLPHTELATIELYSEGRLLIRTDAARFGRRQTRVVPQPAVLQLLADEAAKHSTFHLELGVSMRGFLRENGRVVGVRASTGEKNLEYRADIVVGADGRNAATRKHSGLPELPESNEAYDILWLKVPYPESYSDRETILMTRAASRAGLAFATADGQLQVGLVIPKGGFAALRARRPEDWAEELIDAFPQHLAQHLRTHREVVARATLLNVVCGRMAQWTTPGLLLLGDAAHPMSPVGGQGVNIALRDALVAANHLCPVLSSGGEPAEIDAAARRVQDERWPEIVAVQQMQQHQARILFAPDSWRTRLTNRLLPWLVRSGLLQWMQRKEYRLLSDGAVPVRLLV
jgi:2-polyprenyl-6-methoxyphenol hydroxylase-like FAD-dependent oxidoreductase